MPTPTPSHTRGGRRALVELLLLAAMAVAVVGLEQLRPGAPALGDATRDLFDHLALLDQWSLRVDDWNFPTGGALVPPDLTGMVWAAPWLGLGRTTAYNAAILTQLVLCCWAGWALGRRHGSGLIGGVVVGLSPYLIGQAYSGEAETVAAWAVPLTLVLMELGGARAWAAAGVSAALGAIASWYYGAYLAMYIAAWTLLRGRPWTPGRRPTLLTGGVFAALIAAPAAGYHRILTGPDQLFRGPTMPEYLEHHPRALASMSTDPLGWIGLGGAGAAHVDGLGFIVLALAGLGAWRLWRRQGVDAVERGWWPGVVGVSLALSVGPVLHLGGAQVWAWTPYRLLSELPLFELMRLPHRWLLLATCGLAVLAARGGRRAPWIAAGVIFLEGTWFIAPERPTTEISPAHVHAELRGPVLDLPPRTLGDDARGHYLVWQRDHGQPVPYALLMQGWSPELAREPLFIEAAARDSRDPIRGRIVEAGQFRQAEFAEAVRTARGEGTDAAAIAGAGDRLRDLGIRHVILHSAFMTSEDADELEALLAKELGAPVRVDDRATRWDL